MYFSFLNVHPWLNIVNITLHGPDDGSIEPKRYSVDFLINLSYHLDYLVINFSTYCRIKILYLVSYIYIYIYHDVPLSWISLTLSRHSSLSSTPSGRSSRLHPVTVQSCCRKVLAGRQTLTHPCGEVYKRTSLMSSSFLFQQYPACLIRLIWMVFGMGARWPYSHYFVECCLQDLFNTARSVLVQMPSRFFSNSVHVVHPHNS